MKKILSVLLFLTLTFTIIFLLLKNSNNQKIINKFDSSNNLSCPQADQYFNIVNKNKIFEKVKLIPVDTKIVFDQPRTLAINTTDGLTKILGFKESFGGDKSNAYVGISYLPVQFDIVGDKNNSSTIINTYLPIDYFDSDSINLPIVGLDNSWFALSKKICSYYNGICNVTLYKFKNGIEDFTFEKIIVPKNYLPTTINRQGLEEETTQSSRLESIEGIYNKSIIFKLSKTDSLVEFNTEKNTWQGFSLENTYSKLNNIGNIMKKFGCFYYPTSEGDIVFYKHKLFSTGYPDFKYIDIFLNKN